MTNQLQTENEVVESVKAALVRRGWKIASFATTMQTGIDIHATRGSEVLYVEAKGNTSSKEARIGMASFRPGRSTSSKSQPRSSSVPN